MMDYTFVLPEEVKMEKKIVFIIYKRFSRKQLISTNSSAIHLCCLDKKIKIKCSLINQNVDITSVTSVFDILLQCNPYSAVLFPVCGRVDFTTKAGEVENGFGFQNKTSADFQSKN